MAEMSATYAEATEEVTNKALIGRPAPRPVSLINKVQEHEVWCDSIIQPLTDARLRLDASFRIRLVRAQPVWNLDIGRDLHVQKVVDDVHALLGRGARRPMDAAVREARVQDAERCFEEVGEFIQYVRQYGGICSGVWMQVRHALWD